MGPWPGRICVISSLAPEHIIKPDNFSFRSGYQPINIHWSDVSIKIRLHASGFSNRLNTTFNFQSSNKLYPMLHWVMMCSIHIDESALHVSTVAWSSHLCVPCSEKLDSLLVCLDNRHTVHGFQCNTREWARRDWNDARFCSTAMLQGYKYLLRVTLITISQSFTFSPRVFLSPSSLSHDER
jgi:hypothetical protein